MKKLFYLLLIILFLTTACTVETLGPEHDGNISDAAVRDIGAIPFWIDDLEDGNTVNELGGLWHHKGNMGESDPDFDTNDLAVQPSLLDSQNNIFGGTVRVGDDADYQSITFMSYFYSDKRVLDVNKYDGVTFRIRAYYTNGDTNYVKMRASLITKTINGTDPVEGRAAWDDFFKEIICSSNWTTYQLSWADYNSDQWELNREGEKSDWLKDTQGFQWALSADARWVHIEIDDLALVYYYDREPYIDQ